METNPLCGEPKENAFVYTLLFASTIKLKKSTLQVDRAKLSDADITEFEARFKMQDPEIKRKPYARRPTSQRHA
ncbi:hypothetical protein [Roseovarius sp. M141]|uniref:hypothetical protein n=1 Tax=Roseovarius sp. M141 TaxID=2583806 RepID=UPI0020CD3E6C|nr:hypothetical protein [Roseovarius sp. M141]MCQ0093131.1 hypothetical protein [Roseovarius sp. M141]